jgi:hypothetical protein
MWCIT